MGIFDFLGDLSSKRSRELGLGGLQSLLGTRGAAQAGAIGDEMIGITNQDSLPGYFNEQTREYVPWYVDLFDGGGLNAAGTVAEQEAAQSKAAAAGAMPGGAPVQSPGLLQTRLGNQLSDMEMANRNRAAQMPPGLGSQLSDMEMANRNRAAQMAPSLGSQLSDMEMANRNRVAQMTPGLGGQLSDMEMANRNRVAGPRESTLNTLRENVYSVGPIDAYRNALNNRPDIPLTQPFAGRDDTPRLSEMQTPMMQHPAFPQFVDIMKKMGNESAIQDPAQAQMIFNNYLKQIGYN